MHVVTDDVNEHSSVNLSELPLKRGSCSTPSVMFISYTFLYAAQQKGAVNNNLLQPSNMHTATCTHVAMCGIHTNTVFITKQLQLRFLTLLVGMSLEIKKEQ